MSNSHNLPPGITAGKKYRFLVRSAEEAITIIRERLGPKAKVLSVKQADGQGLSRFIGSPKLEIVATIPPEALEEDAFEQSPQSERLQLGSPQSIQEGNVLDEEKAPAQRKSRPQRSEAASAPTPGQPQKSPNRDNDEADQSPRQRLTPRSAKSIPPQPDEEDAPRDSIRSAQPYAAYMEQKQPSRESRPTGQQSRIWDVLLKSGFDEAFLNTIQYSPEGESIGNKSVRYALQDISDLLTRRFRELPKHQLTARIAFLGSPGTGKTTTLCKRLASDIFIRQVSASVLKIDNDTPNADNALSVFCDVLGVPLLREPVKEDSLPSNETLYIDLPGASLSDPREWSQMSKRLNELYVGTRVLVINAAYEKAIVKELLERGKDLKATHLVFTHIDEVSNVTKLWPIIFGSGLTPLLLSHGQNITNDYTYDFLTLLLEKTFPQHLLS